MESAHSITTCFGSPLISTTLLCLVCGTAAGYDLYSRRIPNWLCFVAAFLGLLFAVLPPQGLADLGSQAVHMFLALGVGMILFAMRMIGGGDAKFYSAAAAWFPLGEATRLIAFVSIGGLVLLLAWFIYRRAMGYPILRSSNSHFDSLPYGLAIGVGAIATAIV